MIDEKKLIQETQKYFVNNSIHKNDLAEVIANLPKVGQWTPCSEMLPPIDMSYPNAKNYLVYYEHGYYDVASYSNINRFWHEYTTEPYWNCQQYCKVVAWMPLPPAFKESEE